MQRTARATRDERRPSRAFADSVSAALVAMALAVPAFGAEPAAGRDPSARPTPPAQASQQHRDQKASDLIGADVNSPGGAPLGEVVDLVIDPDTSTVKFVAVTVGDGAQEAIHPIASSELSPAAADPGALAIDPARAASGQTWTADRWPQMPGSRDMRASKMLGADVQGADGRVVGQLEDVVVNLADGTVHYAVIGLDPTGAVEEKRVVIPISALHASTPASAVTPGALTLDATPATLAGLENVSDADWQDINSPAVIVKIEQQLPASVGSSRAPKPSGEAPAEKR